MASAPVFAATPVIWSNLVPVSGDASYTAPVNTTTLGTAGASGTKIAEIDILPVGTTVSGTINIFLYDGSAYHLFESIAISAATVNSTTPPVKVPYVYDNLVVPSGWSMVLTTVSGNAGLILVTAFGAGI